MFEKEYSFKGSHAQKVIELTAKFNESSSVIKTNVDAFIIGAIVGYLYQKKSIPNNDKTKEGKSITTKIFPDAFYSHQTDLYFAYRLIMLADKGTEPDFQQRLNKAFKYFYEGQNQNDIEQFEQFVLGGIDILYDKLITNAKSEEDFTLNLYNFVEEIQTRYYQNQDDKDFEKQILKLARN